MSPPSSPSDSLPLLQFRSAKVIHEPRGTFWTSVFALVGTMMGAGALSLPSTMAQANVVPDIVLFLFMAVIAAAACNACVATSEHTGKHSFESMAAVMFGPWRQWFVRVLTLVLLFGIQAVFFVVSLDLLHPFVATYVSRLVLGAVLTAVTIPLCLVETMYALRYTNAIVVGCMLYIFVVVGIRAAMVGSWPEQVTDVTTTSAKGLLYALPIQALSFGCQINSVRIYGELKDKTQMTHVNAWTMVLGISSRGYLNRIPHRRLACEQRSPCLGQLCDFENPAHLSTVHAGIGSHCAAYVCVRRGRRTSVSSECDDRVADWSVCDGGDV
ncbi:hypothetical protein, variant 3 [Aphanomyces astaci]|uniref:Amino acid transporter transmembrane domain-containing protein n=1 Tax=Aphanomyces astaci TaxID=112090 RepID=W4GBU8_APHAT|nr:hypothetical protein, variant 2 [Aphanomyces astaci]XP_009833437.1 hypothetical protein, variant 3 [Aphanomyces astaci]ETV77130.1 hypothetical protein, variant 2 [Aphanomyces astaci]ETV77131.1 hypothetical protein, variant 3 [Aphanomyces astaci]|eukprot:XP_009833436.1 hypothetical protein, variant 2 [Aphanomyces astaci]